MASKGTKRGKGGQLDLEAIGLVLLALGVFVVGFLVPSFPTGELGRTLRTFFTDRIGWGAYAIPAPFVVLGGMFLLRRNPPSWPRVLLGYLVFCAGLWSALMLLAPPAAGVWGMELRARLTGVAGALAWLPALLLVTLGVELVFGMVPTSIVRRTAVSVARSVRAAWRGFLAARRRIKERAAFQADVALVRGELRELDRDLEALATLYPGSAELERWRESVGGSLKDLKRADEAVLADARADLKAWKSALRGFTKDRAEELAAQLAAEGFEDFQGWSKGVATDLADPVTGPGKTHRALDTVRKALALDATALADRYRRLTRERDLATTAVKKMSPRELAKASRAHAQRLQEYARVGRDAEALGAAADTMEPWHELAARLARLLQEFAGDEELADLDATLAAELQEKGRQVLAQHEPWGRALEAVELRARQRAHEAARAASARAAASEDEDAEGREEDEAVVAAAASPAAKAHGGSGRGDGGAATSVADSAGAAQPDDGPAAANAGAAGGEADGDPGEWPDWDDDSPPWLVGSPASGIEASVEGEDAAVDGESASGDAADGSGDSPEVGGIPIQLPGFDLLDARDEEPAEDPEALAREVQTRVRKIDETLANFNLQGRVVSSVRGPTVTRFEVEPAPGEKISRFANLSDDLALAMAVGSVRIEAPIPGKSVIGLEVPNGNRDLIRFREAAEAPSFRRSKARLPLILGKSIDGEMVVGDLTKMPHLLIAGSTGSGKSVAVNTLIVSLIYKFLPTDLRFLMIDPKMVELTPFDGIPHLVRPVVTNPSDAAGVLLGTVAHMERRYKMMSKIGAKNLDQYNEKARNLDLPQLPFVVIVIDELADLMITSPKEVESAIMRLAQMARATGMHLVLATQRPSVDILTSLIKVNVPARIAFAVSSGHDSRTILDTMGAERLIGMGDMLFYQPGLVKPVRLQGPFISEQETATLAAFLRRQYFEDEFVEAYGDDFDPPSLHQSDADGMIDWNDDKLRDAAELVINEGQASVSRLQRRLSVGHARAGKLMDSLEALGVVGPHAGSKPRDVLVDIDDLPDIFGK